MTEIDWKYEAVLRHENPDETFLIKLGKEAKASYELAKSFLEQLERINNRLLLNRPPAEDERLYRRCIKIAKEDLDDKHQRLTILRRYYSELITDMKPNQAGQKSPQGFRFLTKSATDSTKDKSSQ